MSRPKINPNIKKLNVCITLTPIVIALAKNKCFQDGKSLSAKIEEMLAAYVCDDLKTPNRKVNEPALPTASALPPQS
jgi:hypothetical protein